jgi:hypothetical protein
MTDAFGVSGKGPARAIAQNGCEQQDKHLIAHLIPISLTMVEQQAAADAARLLGVDSTAKRNGPSAGASSGHQLVNGKLALR